MQPRSKQRSILDAAARANELPTLLWCAESYRAGKPSVIMLVDYTLPVVPVVLWPQLDGHREQADLSRLLAELMCKSMRTRLGIHLEIHPVLTCYDELRRVGVERWEEWQLVEVDWVCPHCGMVNYQPCCADNRKVKK